MRASGVLLHISSLPGGHGIGSFGREAYKFVDFLSESGQSFWQILPLGPTGFGDSPYQAFSTFGGNPYFIDLDILCAQGLLIDGQVNSFTWNSEKDRVNYGILYENRFKVLRMAYDNFKLSKPADFYDFCAQEEYWLKDYALYMAISFINHSSWHNWEETLAKRNEAALGKFATENFDDVEFWKFLQYEFFSQWLALKKYANEKNIQIIGDLPIYVADDSCDVWANPSLFDLDENLALKTVAGVPPDGFSADGQLWGNPVYNWPEHEKTDFNWWTKRLAQAQRLYDYVRIDHFRGFDSYFAIPFEAATAKDGVWREGPGLKLFHHAQEKLGPLNIIAEDLGVITQRVKEMVTESGYPGMKVLEFAFGADENTNDGQYLPHNIPKNTIVYLGTHDNTTAKQWFSELSPADKAFCLDYMWLDSEENFVDKFIKLAFATQAKLAVITMQDWLNLDGRARMNAPSTTGENWKWRCDEGCFTKELSERMRHISKIYRRNNGN